MFELTILHSSFEPLELSYNMRDGGISAVADQPGATLHASLSSGNSGVVVVESRQVKWGYKEVKSKHVLV